MKKTTLLITSLVFLIALGLSGCGVVSSLAGTPEPTPLPPVGGTSGVIAEGRVVPAQSSVLAFAMGGEIGEISVEPGQEAAMGDALMRLADTEALDAAQSAARLAELDASQKLDTLKRMADIARANAGQELAAANLAASEARQALDEFTTQEYRDDLDDKEVDVQEALDDLKDAQEKLDKYSNLAVDHPTRKNAQKAVDNATSDLHQAELERDRLQAQLDQAQAVLDLAKARQAEAKRAFDTRVDGPDPDELALAEQQLKTAKAQTAAAQKALDQAVLTAPYDGVALGIHDLEAGEKVAAGQPVVTFASREPWYVETRDLTELDVVKIEVGQKVKAVPDALPELELSGVVESISQVYTEKSNDVLYLVRIRLEDSDPLLRWGMTVEVTFEE